MPDVWIIGGRWHSVNCHSIGREGGPAVRHRTVAYTLAGRRPAREGGRGLDQADPAGRPIPSQQGRLSLTAWRPARVAGDSGILPFRESGGADGAGDPGGLIVTGGAA